jgi:diguanylate cyclase (GGDEF)-like protein
VGLETKNTSTARWVTLIARGLVGISALVCFALWRQSGDAADVIHSLAQARQASGIEASFDDALVEAEAAASTARFRLLWVGAAAYGTTALALFGAAGMRRSGERASLRQEAVFAAAKRFEAISADSPDIVFVLGAGGEIAFMSASGHSVFGDRLPTNAMDIVQRMPETTETEAITWLDRVADARISEPVVVHTHNAERRLFDVRMSDRRTDPLIRGRVFTCRDVTAEVLLQNRLRTRAATDDLTGLPNRRELSKRMHEHWPSSEPSALVMIDLDDFKRTNDTLGHAAGDLLLVLVAQRFETVIAVDQTLVRLGGDEFAVFVAGEAAAGCAVDLANALVECLRQPIDLAGRNVRIGASIGVCCSAGCEDPTELMRRADIAMYEAKALVGSSVIAFEASMELQVRKADAINRALQQADVANDFTLAYQPIFEADGTRPRIVEALLRWNHDELGFIPPDHFIPAAENSGAIVRIGCWVLWESLGQLRRWDHAGVSPDVAVAVNVSYVQLEEQGFVEDVLAALEGTGMPGNRLVLEITETVMALDNRQVAEVLAELQAYGVRIAIDDFGTGYSSLGQLLHLPFDLLKLDRSFLLSLDEAGREAAGRAVIEATVRMSEACGVPIVAEGIEEIEQLDLLISCGVHYAQGYLLARPGPPDDVLPLLLGQVSQAVAV